MKENEGRDRVAARGREAKVERVADSGRDR